MSFKDEDDNYFRIIDVPLVQYNKSYTAFNEYRLPILFCCNDPTIRADVGRLIIRDVFSRASHAEDPVECIKQEYTEVPTEEFDAELEKALRLITVRYCQSVFLLQGKREWSEIAGGEFL